MSKIMGNLVVASVGMLIALTTIISASANEVENLSISGEKLEKTVMVESMEKISVSDEILKAGDGFIAAGVIDTIVESFETQNLKPEQVVYSIDEFSPLAMTSNGTLLLDLYLSFAPRSLYQVNYYWPITNLQKVSDQLVYTTYSVRDEQGHINTMYIFFEKQCSKETEAPADAEYWYLTGHVFFMNKPLSFKDFDAIDVGSDIDAVAAIDPTVRIQCFNASNQATDQAANINSLQHEIKTYHYLTDGIVCITYSKGEAGYSVSAVDFNDAFKVPGEEESAPLLINSADYAS